jgi:hypothetical protein
MYDCIEIRPAVFSSKRKMPLLDNRFRYRRVMARNNLLRRDSVSGT